MSGKIVQSKRLRELPPYIFSEINKIKESAKKQGMELLSLGIGDPDKPTPKLIVDKLQSAVQDLHSLPQVILQSCASSRPSQLTLFGFSRF